jgi:hypothetical protein
LEREVMVLENERSDLEEIISKLEDNILYPRKEITLPELMKFELLKDNWDYIKLEDLEKIVDNVIG